MIKFKYQMFILIFLDILLVTYFFMTNFKINNSSIILGIVGILLDIAVLVVSFYMIKTNHALLNTSEYAKYKYFIYLSSLLVFLP